MMSSFFFSLLLLSLAFCKSSASSRTTATTVTTTCNIRDDITSAVTSYLTTYYFPAALNVEALANIFTSNYAGFTSIAGAAGANAINTTLNQYMWSLTRGSLTGMCVGYTNSQLMCTTWSTTYDEWILTYSAAGSTSIQSYRVNQVTGEPLGPPFKSTSAFYTTQRPWYINGVNNRGALTVNPLYGSLTTALLLISVNKAIYSPVNGALLGVVQSTPSLTLPNSVPTLSQYLMALSLESSTLVYVMQTSTGLLMGSSVNAPLSLSIYGNNSMNTFISGSARYLQTMKINTPTSVYVPSLGYAITVDFLSTSYAAWTVVSVNYATLYVSKDTATSTVVQMTENGDDDTPLTTTETVTYVNESCTVEIDITKNVQGWLSGYLSQAAWGVNATASVFSSNYAGFANIANSGSTNSNPINSTMQSFLWNINRASNSICAIGYSNSYFFGYTYVTTTQQFAFMYEQANAAGNLISYYSVNQATGQVSSSPYKTATFYTTQRPWYIAGSNAKGQVTFSSPYGSVTSASFLVPVSAQIFNPTNGAVLGVVACSVLLNTPAPEATISQVLASMPVPANTVVYIFDTANYLLVGSSVNAPVGYNIMVNSSTNIYISKSSEFLIVNSLQYSETTVYAATLGWEITTKLEKYLDLSLTIVAVNYKPTGVNQVTSSSTTTYETNVVSDSGSSNGISSQQTSTVIGLGAVVLALCVAIAVLLLVLVVRGRGSTPGQGSATTPMATNPMVSQGHGSTVAMTNL